MLKELLIFKKYILKNLNVLKFGSDHLIRQVYLSTIPVETFLPISVKPASPTAPLMMSTAAMLEHLSACPLVLGMWPL